MATAAKRVVYKLTFDSQGAGLSQYLAPSLPPLPAADDSHAVVLYARFHELAQVWPINHSLLQDHICRITYLSICVMLEFRRLLKMHLFY